MEQRTISSGTAAGDARISRSPYHRSARRLYGSFLGLSLVGILLAPEIGAAQSKNPLRLNVRPREMATGTQNAQAGEQPLDSPRGTLVYVPPQAVGATRVPLVVFLPGGGQNARELMEWHRPFADKYGMIILALDVGGSVAVVDAALEQVLRQFAVDPDKIALAGSSNGAHFGYPLGRANLDVFSRLGMLSWFQLRPVAEYPPNTTTQFFLSAGGLDEALTTLQAGQQVRTTGHPVEEVLVLKSHSQRVEDYDHMWSWLQKSWGTPTPKDQIVPRVVTDATPVLTVDALTRMNAFWTTFMKKPDLIRTLGRQRRYQQQFILPVGEQRMLLRLMDMAELAAKYPPVAADLKSAGLTAKQHDAYRAAIIGASINALAIAEGVTEPAAATSALGKNIAFIGTDGKELSKKLQEIGMWSAP